MQDCENNLSVVDPTTARGNGAASDVRSSKVERSQKSGATGPRTTQGKERSKHNALKHGIFSKVALLKNESRAEYDALLNGLRENLQPEGTLEEMLIEKLALCAWRQRRLITAETAEIQTAVGFLALAEEDRQAEKANRISGYKYHGGLVQEIANAKVLERCLELLQTLKEGIEDDGFAPKWDAEILTKLYGQASDENWQRTLFDSYRSWLRVAELPEDKRLEHKFQKPNECKESFLAELNDEIKRLERYKKARSSMDAEKMKLDVLRRHVPLTPQFDHLLRYEASLERNFDRTLTQLERLQRMRRGQPVPPKLEVHHSLS